MEAWPGLLTDDARRVRVEAEPARHGLDRVEVLPEAGPLAQRVLEAHFLPKATAAGRDDLAALLAAIAAAPGAVRVHGGVRVIGIAVERVEPAGDGDRLRIQVDRPGDVSTYELRVEPDLLGAADRARLDPAFLRVPFSFKAGCPDPLDCRPPRRRPPREAPDIAIDYMAKDYASFRQALLDLAPTLLPGWTDRHEADLTMTLVELLAYVGDQLSYHQDAVANEAWLQTARQRISVRRHARLLDYRMHDGLSARVFVQFQVAGPGTIPPRTSVLTRIDRPIRPGWQPGQAEVPQDEGALPLREAQAVFETVGRCRADPDANAIPIHSWGARSAVLPEGATSADLATARPGLVRPGDLLLLEETAGPTGLEAAVDRSRRQVVRVVAAEPAEDTLLGVAVTRVTWHDEDRLRFPLRVCVERKGTAVPTAVARGNVALASHGRTVEAIVARGEGGVSGRVAQVPLPVGPLSFEAVDVTEDGGPPSAAALQRPDPRRSRPVLDRVRTRAFTAAEREEATSADWREVDAGSVRMQGPGIAWTSWSLPDQPEDADPLDLTPLDLFASEPFEAHVLPEADNDGRPVLRFGDGTDGRRGPADGVVHAQFRVGVGAAGNVGRGTIGHVVARATAQWPGVKEVTNPLPAWGGIDPQPLEEVKRLAPHAFRSVQLRAVTEEDYQAVAERHPAVQKAAARFRWTGSWPTVFVSVDPRGGVGLADGVARSVRAFVSRFALAGYEVVVQPPDYVPLHLEVDVCAAPSRFRAHVEAAVREALLGDGRAGAARGFFHPDAWTFGQPVVLSRLYAALAAVDGVASAEVRVLQPVNRPEETALRTGQIKLTGTQVALLGADPGHRNPGRLVLRMAGGR